MNKKMPAITLKALAFYIAFVFSYATYGQMSFLNDTIRINEVVVKGTLLSPASDGYKLINVDSTVIKEYNLGNISEIISENTPVFIKSYGMGGAATTSFRGTGASNTQLAWNGININSPMLGQADISLIPAGFLDDIGIYSGGASMWLNCGGLGGIINIETKPDWKKGGIVSLNPGIGSFDRYTGLIKARAGGNNFQTVTKAYFQSAENDFIINAQIKQMAFLQELYLRGERSVASARVWYQKSDRNLPTDEGENQLDEFFRALVNYTLFNGKADYDISVSWFSDRLDYFNPVYSIDSKNHSNTFLGKAGVETILGEKIRLRVVLNNELNFVKSVNYSDLKNRNVTSLTASVKRVFGDKTNAVILVRQILNDRHLLVPDFSTGMDIKPVDSREYHLKFNFSRNSKVPSLNDMYWNPGGNPDLKNEYSYTGEISWMMKGNILLPVEYNTELTFFSNNIMDMIQWVPVPPQLSLWSPSNISKVKTSGLEAVLNLTLKTDYFTVKFTGQYALTDAHIDKTGDTGYSDEQMVYVPQHQLNTGIRVNYKNLYSSWITCFTGRRIITEDNSQPPLPDYTLNNLIAGYRIKNGKDSFDLNLKIDNIFGVNYKAIANYPMPGRSFLFSITYHFVKR
jgi:vitamin B12 transporter